MSSLPSTNPRRGHKREPGSRALALGISKPRGRVDPLERASEAESRLRNRLVIRYGFLWLVSTDPTIPHEVTGQRVCLEKIREQGMALEESYPEKFLRLLAAYPKWPAGRTRKALAFKAYQQANRVLKFTDSDIEYIVGNIERRKRDCETWQTGNKFGPVGLQVYINQRLWNEAYEKVKRRAYDMPRESTEPEQQVRRADPEKVRQMLAEAKRGIRH